MGYRNLFTEGDLFDVDCYGNQDYFEKLLEKLSEFMDKLNEENRVKLTLELQSRFENDQDSKDDIEAFCKREAQKQKVREIYKMFKKDLVKKKTKMVPVSDSD